MATELPMPGENDQPGYFFPGFIPSVWKNRTLAYFDGIHLTTEHNEQFFPLNYWHFSAFLFTENLLTFVESVLDFRWLDEVIERKGVVFSTKKGIPTALQIHGKLDGHHQTRWLITSSAWQQKSPNGSLLARLRSLYEHCGVGTPSTPGALGIRLQKQALYNQHGDNWYAHRQPLPPYRCVTDLADYSSGARNDLLVDPTEVIPEAWEIDMKNGYGASFCTLPSGPAIPHQGKFLSQYATFVTRCVVFVTDPLPLGCFPVRQEDGSISFPTSPGRYDTFLWKEEIEIAVKSGCNIIEGPGWGWLSMTNEMQPWVEMMTHLRDTAPPEIVDWLKLAIVAGIGRHGCSWKSSYLVPEGEQQEGDIEAAWHGLAYDYYVHFGMLQAPESMQHWFSYTLMKCRVLLYQEALPYALQGELLATDTDGFYLRGDADVSGFVDKGNAVGFPAGTWRKSKLTSVQFPARRHMISDQKTKKPGTPHA